MGQNGLECILNTTFLFFYEMWKIPSSGSPPPPKKNVEFSTFFFDGFPYSFEESEETSLNNNTHFSLTCCTTSDQNYWSVPKSITGPGLSLDTQFI